MNGFGTVEYMIAGLCIIVFCIVFSEALKRLLLFGARAALGLFAVKLINTAFAGAGVSVGINFLNGALIGILGLPALIGLYAVRLLGL